MEKVVKEGEPNPEEPTPQKEQETPVSEDVKPPVSDEIAKENEHLRNVRAAIKAEKERLAVLQDTPQTPAEEPPVQDEAYQRFVATEKRSAMTEKELANIKIELKSQSDPSFKLRKDLIIEYMENGYSFEDADDKALAFFVRKDLMEQTPEQKSKVNQLPNTATPEEEGKISEETQAELDQFDRIEKSLFGK